MKNKLDLSNHSITVETLQEAINGAYAIGYPIAITAKGVTESQGFVAHSEREFITMVYDALLSSSDDRITINAFVEDEELSAEDIYEFDKLFKEVISDEILVDCMPNCTNFGYDAAQGYSEEDSERDEFNNLCRRVRVVCAGGTGVSIENPYDPYNNVAELHHVLQALITRLPQGIRFIMDAGEDETIVSKMRWFISRFAQDKYILSEKEQFNEMCKVLVAGYNIYDCNANDIFDPYNKIEHLAPIIPIVTRRVSESFTLGEIMYDLPREESYNMNLFDNMRHYVQRHGQELLDILDNCDDG